MGRQNLLLSTTMLSGVVGALLFVTSAAHAADLSLLAATPLGPAPAVDAFNAKFEGLGGTLKGKSLYGTEGSFTFPLANQYGAQVDFNAGSLDNSTYGAVAGHFFWRDPSRALLGVYASYTQWDRLGGVNVSQVAAEGEYYFGRFTVQGILGAEFGNTVTNSQTTLSSVPIIGGVLNSSTTVTQGFSIGTRYFDQINLKYYLNDFADAYVGHRYLAGKNMAAFGGEWAFPVARGVLGSAFAEGRVGDNNNYGVWGGIKLYFGPDDKPLIARHRQEDPNNWTTDTLFTIINSSTSSGSTSPTQLVCNHGINPETGTCNVAD